MKRLLMAIAIAAAANLATVGIQSASANDAHHPAAQTNKAKKVKAAPTKAKKVKTSGMSMQCPMMKGHMMKPHMMKRHMMQHGKMMKCPMMGAAGSQPMGMMHGAGAPMGMNTMRHGEVMMGHRNPCWVMIDRERSFGYQGACNH